MQRYTMPRLPRTGARTPVVFLAVLILFAAGGAPGLVPRAHAQGGTVAGRVYDADTGGPLSGANVFLAYSLRGTSTDADGRFALEGVLPGSYEVVASMVGYEPRTVRVDVRPGAAPDPVVLRLDPVVYELGGVEVTAEKPRGWEEQYRLFETHFLGTSGRAAACAIVNPYVLDFEVDGLARTLSARAAEPLVVENRALGYRVTFVLQEFHWDPHEERLRLRGLPRFEPLAPADDEEARRWAENRETAFKGSLPHLLRSLAAGRSFDEGYLLRLHGPVHVVPVDGRDLLRPAEASAAHLLSFDGTLEVRFRGRIGGGGFFSRRVKEVDYRLQLNAPELLVDADGSAAPAGALRSFGYAARVADLLPREYDLETTPMRPGDPSPDP